MGHVGPRSLPQHTIDSAIGAVVIGIVLDEGVTPRSGDHASVDVGPFHSKNEPSMIFVSRGSDANRFRCRWLP